ncbi:PREDICTED: uncharacterized protein LOC106539244, partial [Thamnophis sirtalis]|uniref:Uncharacterized protein LOC106539244 n=1 Tax=Thamnophis sirtalis TaxID=35019 RepID=A0A6I9X6K4_9SAUR
MESTTYHSEKAGTKKENSRKQIGLTSEILSTSCRSRNKSLKQNTIIKASFVLLKNINRGRKEKHDYYLTAPRGKQLAPPTQHKKFPAFRKLQVALYDILDKNCVATLKKSFQISNVGALVEKEKKDTTERGTTEVDNSMEVGEFSGELDPGQTNSDCDLRKSISRMILTDKKSHEGDRCQVSERLSSFSEINLKLDLQTLMLNKSEIKLPIKEMMGLSLNTLTEKVREDQTTLEEEESNTRNSSKNTERFWFLLKNNEIRYDDAPVCVADEKMAGDLVCRDDGLSDHSAECLLSDGNLANQTYPDENDGAFIHTEIKKATMSVEDQEVSFFNDEKENMDCLPAEENISVEEEENFPLCQSQSVKMVFYELFGSLVKLLGSPSVNQKKSRLGRLTELEDSSDAEKREGSDTKSSSKRKKEDRLCLANRAMHLDCRTKEKTTPK